MRVVANVQIDGAVAVAHKHTDVVRANLCALDVLKLNDSIEDILITLNHQYHLIRPLTSHAGQGLFRYVCLTKSRSNLAVSHHRLRTIEQELLV